MRRAAQGMLLVGALLAAAALSACDQQTTTCSSPAATAATTAMLKDAVTKEAILKAKKNDGTSALPEANIRSAIELLRISFDEIRTTKNDPNSTKKFCSATAKVVFPLSLLSDADRARELTHLNTVADLAQAANVTRSADTFTFSADYSVQPTDDHKTVFSESDSLGGQIDFVSEVVVSYLLKGQIEAQNTQEQQQQQAAVDQQKQAGLDEAKAEDALSIQTINAAWNALDPDMRAQLLDVQRAWIKKKEADCEIEAASASLDPLEKETARLKCDTKQNQDRVAWINQYAPR